jgi:salicylate hydroxylase
MASSQVRLNIVIIGAGIAGTATATCLAQKGNSVRLLEIKNDLSELGAGIQIQSNSSRPLHAWGLKEAFEKCACVPDVLLVKRYDNGEVIGVRPWNSAAEELFGYP